MDGLVRGVLVDADLQDCKQLGHVAYSKLIH